MEIIAWLLLAPFMVLAYYGWERAAHWKSQYNHQHMIAEACINAYNARYLGEKKNE